MVFSENPNKHKIESCISLLVYLCSFLKWTYAYQKNQDQNKQPATQLWAWNKGKCEATLASNQKSMLFIKSKTRTWKKGKKSRKQKNKKSCWNICFCKKNINT